MPKTKLARWNTLWCCNPFGLERHSRQIGKRKVTTNMRKKFPKLVVGDAICDRCRLRISKTQVSATTAYTGAESEVGNSTSSDDNKTQTEAGKSSEEEFIPESKESATVSNLNTLLTPLGVSPVSKSKLSRVKSYAHKKAAAINEAINTSIFNVRGDISEGQEIIGQFKEKFETVSTANEKYMILTCLPKSWSENRIRSEFNVSPYILRK